ncbi:efflux transporter, outer membrane factor (OMF) lipoprotein, NodT family [Solimonas aquatica]|uniref:Efflux transporter, outer membrane factor (OMF) lipoprotein, NodT family n=1 Tax=Solimonas aquatica TaxID=489703 RepID=A0A1H9EX14_9GAMM|nr:efflux transporter outer membrane subunit [Solimonas aquatica]SEQ29743.1 efflux transporter, outer membrane factor (OMF) lipoprotein, NodT family [Solimonas aquatica]
MKPQRLSLIAAAALLGACVLPQKEAPRTQAIDTQQLGLAGAAFSAAPEAWWQSFGDAQLDALIAEALAHNPSLDEALARMRGAQAQSQAAAAGGKPRYALDGSVQRQRLSENYIYPPAASGFNPHGGGTYWFADLGLNLNWDLDFWGRQADLLRQARGEQQAVVLDHEAARLALAGAIAQAYVDLHRAYGLIDIATQSLTQRQTQLQLSQQRLQAGLDNALQLQNAQAQLAQAQVQLQQAQTARELAVHRLAALSGHGADAYAQLKRPQLKLDAALPLPEQLPIDLLAHRPDVLAARARVDAAGAGRDAARAAFYPDVSLKIFAGYQSVGLDQLLQAASAGYGAGPGLHLPLFDSQRLRADYRGATAQLDLVVAQYNQTVLDAVRDVADQLSQVSSLEQQLAQQQNRVQAAQRAQQLAQQRYGAGLGSRLPVLDLQLQTLGAQRELLDSSCQLITSRVSLLLMLGGSFHSDTQQAAVSGTPRS